MDDDVGRRSSWARSSAAAPTKPHAPSGVEAPIGMMYGLRPALAEFLRRGLHARRAPAAIVDVANLGAKQAVEQGVAGRTVRRGAVDHEDAAEAELGGRRGGHPRVVRLDPAAGDQRVGARVERVGRHQLHLPDLVSAERKRQRIVPLDEEAGAAAERAAQAVHFLDG